MATENINSDQEAVKTRGELNRARSKKGVNRRGIADRGFAPSENLAPELQPGAAQLLRKYQNRLRKQQERLSASKLGKTAMPIMEHIASGRPLSEISSPEMKDALQDVPEDMTGEEDEPSVLAQTVRSLGEVAEKRSRSEAIKQGIKTGILLRKNVDSHRTEVFLIALIFALTKDLMDIGFLELASWIDWTIDLFIVITLRIFLFGKGTWKVRIALWIAGPIEMIPIFGALPTWTLCVLYAWYKSWKKARDSKGQLEELNKKMKGLIGSGGRGGLKGGKRRLERFREPEKLAEETVL